MTVSGWWFGTFFSIYWDHPNWLIILFRDFQRGWNHQPGMIRKIPDSGSRHGSEWFLYYESQRPSSCPCLVNLQVLGLWWMLRIDNSHKTTYKVWVWTWTRYIWADCNHILWVLYCCFFMSFCILLAPRVVLSEQGINTTPRFGYCARKGLTIKHWDLYNHQKYLCPVISWFISPLTSLNQYSILDI